MQNILDKIIASKATHLEELVEFLKIPSVSSQKSHDTDTRIAAEWVASKLEKAGLESVNLHETKGHPIVYGEWLGAKGKPTVLVYGHYDVQPVEPLELWTSPPFAPEVRDNKLFGRGTSDDKGQVFAHIKAVEAHLSENGKLPVNVKFIIEGEEECGSDNLDIFIKENKEMLKCDTVLISDTEWFAEGLPSICYSLRGISYVEVELTGPNRDLHSGTFGGAVDNPINALCSMIAKLKDEYGRITIPGFYDDVVELSEEEREGFKKLPFNQDEYNQDLNIDLEYGEAGFTTLERVGARPSLDLNGIVGGYTGDGAKTVLPSKASAKISMRLVANQDHKDISRKIMQHLEAIAPPTMKIKVSELHGGNPVLVPRDSKGVHAAMKALKKAFNVDPVFMREGGSIPIVGLFEEVLSAPTVLMGLGLPSDNIHSPDENFDLHNFYGGIKASALFFDEFAKL